MINRISRVCVSLFAVTLVTSLTAPLIVRAQGKHGQQVSDQQAEETPNGSLILKLRPINTTATALVQKIKTMPQFGPNSGITYQANPGDNSIVVTAASEQQYRNFQQAVRFLDTPNREVTVNAEVVLMLGGKDGKNHKAAVAMRGRTASEGTIKLQTTAEEKAFSDSPIVISAGDYNVTLKPTINGDDSIQVEAEVILDLTYRLPGDSRSQHLRQKFSGSARYRSGDTILLASATLKSQNGKTQANAAELLIFLTPTLIQSRMPQQPVPGGVLPTPAVTKAGGKREAANAPPTLNE